MENPTIKFSGVLPDDRLEIQTLGSRPDINVTHTLTKEQARKLAHQLLQNSRGESRIKPCGPYYLIDDLKSANAPNGGWAGTVIDFGDACGAYTVRSIGDRIYFSHGCYVSNEIYSVHTQDIVAVERVMGPRSFDVPEKPISWTEVGPSFDKMRKLPSMLFRDEDEYIRAAEILRRSK